MACLVKTIKTDEKNEAKIEEQKSEWMVTKVRALWALFRYFSGTDGRQQLLLQNALDPNMVFFRSEFDKIFLHVSLNRCRLVRFSFYLAVAGWVHHHHHIRAWALGNGRDILVRWSHYGNVIISFCKGKTVDFLGLKDYHLHINLSIRTDSNEFHLHARGELMPSGEHVLCVCFAR